MDDRRNVKLWAALIGAMFAVLLIVAALDLRKNQTNVQQISIPNSLSSIAAFGNDSFVYSDGTTLKVHNVDTGKTSALTTANAGLNQIDSVSVSPNSNYILFHDRTFNTNGTLGLILGNRDPGLDWWWLYNVKTQTFQPLPQGVILAKVDNNSVYILSASNGTEQLTTYSPANLKQTASINVVGSSNFYPVSGGFLLQTPDNQLIFTKDGTVSNQLFQNILLAGVTNDGQTAVGIITQNGSRNLVAINVQSDTTTTIASDVGNAPAWLGSGSVLYINSQDHLESYNLQTKQGSNWALSGNLQKVDPNYLKLVALVGPSAAVISSSTSANYYLIGNGLAAEQQF